MNYNSMVVLTRKLPIKVVIHKCFIGLTRDCFISREELLLFSDWSKSILWPSMANKSALFQKMSFSLVWLVQNHYVIFNIQSYRLI